MDLRPEVRARRTRLHFLTRHAKRCRLRHRRKIKFKCATRGQGHSFSNPCAVNFQGAGILGDDADYVVVKGSVFFVIFLLLYTVFKSAAEAAVLIFPTVYAMSGGLILQWVLGYNFSVAVWVGYIALLVLQSKPGCDGGLLARSAAAPACHGNAYDRW